MTTVYTKPARGIRKRSPIVAIGVAATPEVLYQRTEGGQTPRTVILRKIMVYNNTGFNAVVAIGTGLGGAFAAIIPPLAVIDGFDNQWNEDDIAVDEVGVSADLTVQSSVAAVQVQVEVEEIGA